MEIMTVEQRSIGYVVDTVGDTYPVIVCIYISEISIPIQAVYHKIHKGFLNTATTGLNDSLHPA